MSSSLPSPPSSPSRISDIAFGLWIVGGIVLVAANWCVWDRFVFEFPNEHTNSAFLYINPTPEQQARLDFRARLVWTGWCLEAGSIVYGLVGAVLFRQRGRGVIAIAVAIVLLSLLAELDVNFW